MLLTCNNTRGRCKCDIGVCGDCNSWNINAVAFFIKSAPEGMGGEEQAQGAWRLRRQQQKQNQQQLF
jgi:hypothetical protein